MKLGELASRLGCRLEGAPEVEIHGTAGIEEAGPGQVTFLTNPRYARELAKTRATAVLLDDKAVVQREPGAPALAALR